MVIAQSRVSETEVCWDLAPEVVECARKAAAIVRKQYPDARTALDYDDLFHEGLLWLATHPGTIASHQADPQRRGLRRVEWDLRSRLVKIAKREAAQQRQFASLDALVEDGFDLKSACNVWHDGL